MAQFCFTVKCIWTKTDKDAKFDFEQFVTSSKPESSNNNDDDDMEEDGEEAKSESEEDVWEEKVQTTPQVLKTKQTT